MYKKTISVIALGLCLGLFGSHLSAAKEKKKKLTLSEKTKKQAAQKAKKAPTPKDIFELSKKGTWKDYKAFIVANPTALEGRDAQGNTSLHYALENRKPLISLHAIQTLQANTKAVEIATAKNHAGHTPLDAAIAGGSPRLVILMALFLRAEDQEISEAAIAAAKAKKEWSIAVTKQQKLEGASFWQDDASVTGKYFDYLKTISKDEASTRLAAVLKAYNADETRNLKLQDDFRNALDAVVLKDLNMKNGSSATPPPSSPAPEQEPDEE